MRTRTLSGLQCHHSAQRDRTAVHLCVEASGRKAERRRGQEEEAGHRGCGRLAAGQRAAAETARAAAPTAGGIPADDGRFRGGGIEYHYSSRTWDRLAAGAPARRDGARRTAERLVGAAERALAGDKKMLLLLSAAAHGQVEQVKITNGTGLYCRGCAVLVEAVHEQLMATRVAETRVPVACVG